MDYKRLIRTNNFVCRLNMNGVDFDSDLVEYFHDNINEQQILICYQSDERSDYEEKFYKAWTQKCGGKLSFCVYGYNNQIIKEIDYNILSISDIKLPEYSKNDDIAKYVVILSYTKRDMTYFRSDDVATRQKNEKELKENKVESKK